MTSRSYHFCMRCRSDKVPQAGLHIICSFDNTHLYAPIRTYTHLWNTHLYAPIRTHAYLCALIRIEFCNIFRIFWSTFRAPRSRHQQETAHRLGRFATPRSGRQQETAVVYRTRNCTVQYSTVQYSTVQYSTVRYSTVLYCTVK